MNRRRIAWVLILIVDAAYIVWGAGAAIAQERLPGPGGMAILPAAYQGFTGSSWAGVGDQFPDDGRIRGPDVPDVRHLLRALRAADVGHRDHGLPPW